MLLRTSADVSSDPARFCVATLPVNHRIEMGLLAARLCARRLTVASAAELTTLLDYPPRGVSPLGVSGIPVFMDRELEEFETVLVGSGIAGVEVEIAPRDLIAVTGATVMRFS